MDAIIAVIGSVTAKQYPPLRLQLLREGLKPKVVRIPADFFPTDRYGDMNLRLLAKMFGVSEYELTQDGVSPHFSPYFTGNFGVDPSKVHCVVIDGTYNGWTPAELHTFVFDTAELYVTTPSGLESVQTHELV